MVRGLRQRITSKLSTNNNNNGVDIGNGTILPLNKPNVKNATKLLHKNRRRMKRRRRGWEYRIKLRVVCINLCTCCILVGIIGILYHYEPNKLPLSKLVRRTSLQKQPLDTTTTQQQSKIEYNFQCTSNLNQKAVLNDNYCDCADGSDEPNTSACSHLLVGKRVFTCNNVKNGVQNREQKNSKKNRRRRLLDRLRGRIVDSTNHDSSSDDRGGVTIYTSRVHDGIIDCPNQADEL